MADQALAVTEEDDFPGHLLHRAALWDNAELLADLLNGELKTFINSQDSWGRYPLHAAATTDCSSCLGILLTAGANPNSTSGAKDNYMTPLHVSAEHGFLSNVQKLVEAGGDISRLDGRSLSAVDLAERGGHYACYEYLKGVASLKESTRLNLHSKLRDAATRFDLASVKTILDSMESSDIQSIVNETSHGSNSLLFKAAEAGNKQLVQLLCENGADGRVHPVTKYSPLYIACYYGHREVVTYLLEKFPTLIGVPTVEKWLPLHAACINGHTHIVDLILKYNYPSSIFKAYRSPNNPDLEIELPFDINLKDVSGQTALYITCQMGNQKIVDILLRYKVEGKSPDEIKAEAIAKKSSKASSPTDGANKESPTKKRVISEGIKGLMSKLSLASNQNLAAIAKKKPENLVCPFDINTYCEDYQTALHAAVKGRHSIIVSLLLQHGADPNMPLKTIPQTVTPYEQVKQSKSLKKEEFSTALAEACRLRDLGMVDILIKFGARDDDCKALTISCLDDIVIGKILSLKAHQDSENKINIQYIKDNIIQASKKPLLINTILPSVPVTINWHNQKLSKINENWLITATLKINPKLRLCPMNQNFGLHSITRLDLSSNNLESFPSIIFTFCSLVYLNLSQNKISSIKFPGKISSPLLEEVLLNENRIELCPAELFTEFPSLMILNLANNKLNKLPSAMWECKKLQELNLSLNLLTDLPAMDVDSLSEEPTSMIFDSLPYFQTQTGIDSSTLQSPELQKSPSFLGATNLFNERSSSPLLNHFALWRQHIQITQVTKESANSQTNLDSSSLLSLNISHNSFHKIPKVLACLASKLQRLNVSYNRLRYIGHLGYFPSSLKQLDLSHNNIEKWFYSVSNSPGTGEPSIKLKCFASGTCGDDLGDCIHKRHTSLSSLKSLILAGNHLKHIEVGGETEVVLPVSSAGDKRSSTSKYLWFPNITQIDLGDNQLMEVTKRIAELKSLSVLNISGNINITDLPPELGTLKHLWNLNLNGCNLQEPLLSMIERKRYKTMDIIGYLKSVLENSKPYTRMKLMVVGVAGIGKTTLLGQMRQETSSGQHKNALQQDHWAKRMAFQNAGPSASKSSAGSGLQKSGKPISTVGVDIGSWVLEPRGARNGPVILRTWDFGGQREYYATHLYFLSKRSLYLVVWNISDGEKGLNEIVQWLVNIQSRAPQSPVIIVGTHYDLISEKFPPGYYEYLQQRIREKFICVPDAEKRGLPRVLYSIEISCKTRYNMKYLINLIYDTVWNLRTNNGKVLLEQKIPSKYIHLEEISAYLAQERKSQGLEPILTENEFKLQVASWLQKGFSLTFRDDAEIMQACTFLHENGILLHFEDSVLHDLYFLDPQSLCDLLANVITIREINPFVKNGLMRINDLSHLFKGKSNLSKDYILNLLSKFELAIPIDQTNMLLIPSLLPSYEQMKTGQFDVKININIKSRRLGSSSTTPSTTPTTPVKIMTSNWTPEPGKLTPLSRFVLLSYFPSGFWSRLISRILSDTRIVEIIKNYFIPRNFEVNEIVRELNQNVEWALWQNGMELIYGPTTILYLKEVTGEKPFSFMLRRDETVCEIVDSKDEVPNRNEPEEQVWEVVDMSETSLLEIHVQTDNLKHNSDEPEHDCILESSLENVTKLLALVVEHIDTLLEDWYPSIGTRFVHTSEGKYLVTRLIPCPRCFPNHQEGHYHELEHPQRSTNSPDYTKSPRQSSDSGFGNSPTTTRAAAQEESAEDKASLRTRTGLVFETPKFTNSTSVMSGLNYFLKPDTKLRNLTRNMYSWTVEHCILESQKNNSDSVGVKCPKHGQVLLQEIAPDILFLDLSENSIVKLNEVQRDKLLGRGAFGFVFGGILKQITSTEVAIKMFQPVDPTTVGGTEDKKSESINEAQMVYKLAYNKWQRSPSQSACRAYSACRGEVRVLYWVKHEHIVPFIGLCQSPLSIVLKKAPYGSLNKILNDFKRSGDHLKDETLKACLLQIASALDYLHRNHIIYKDLKSENVLCWQFPVPFAIRDMEKVDIKLADYGISRSSFTTGSTKGFGGTEGYMAPEIIRYNGEEEYTEKVDIFSFGMLLYELITLKLPFDNYDNIKECILDGDRPLMTNKECSLYPLYFYDLMVTCWSNAANERPTAAEIITTVSSVDFLLLRDCVLIDGISNIVTSIGIEYGSEKEIWASCSTGGIYCLKLHKSDNLFDSCHCFEVITGVVTAMCQINNEIIWMGDTTGKIHSLRVSDYGKITEIDLEAQIGSCGAITFIETIGTSLVAIIVSSGRLFLLDPDNGSVVTELGSSGTIHCLTCRPISISTENEFEIWTGEKAGQMTIFTIKNNIVVGQETINHYEAIQIDGVQVFIVKVHINNEMLFSYVYPGSVIYGWDSENREMHARLDVGRLLPIRDTCMDDLSLKPLQVTLIHSTSEHVYIGTNWGFIFITDVKYLKPVTILQPFQEDIRSFWIFNMKGLVIPNSRRASIGSELTESQEESNSSPFKKNAETIDRPPSICDIEDSVDLSQHIVVLGKEFSSIIPQQQHLPVQMEDQKKKRIFAILWKINLDSWN